MSTKLERFQKFSEYTSKNKIYNILDSLFFINLIIMVLVPRGSLAFTITTRYVFWITLLVSPLWEIYLFWQYRKNPNTEKIDRNRYIMTRKMILKRHAIYFTAFAIALGVGIYHKITIVIITSSILLVVIVVSYILSIRANRKRRLEQ